MNIPILNCHDQWSKPLGWLTEEDGRLFFKLNPDAQVETEALEEGFVTFAPGYQVTKEKDGVILEAELLELSVVPVRVHGKRYADDT